MIYIDQKEGEQNKMTMIANEVEKDKSNKGKDKHKKDDKSFIELRKPKRIEKTNMCKTMI